MQRKKKALEAAQEDINAGNSRIIELTQQINDLLSSNNDYLVCLHLFYFSKFLSKKRLKLFLYFFRGNLPI